uniref:Uncharacterized protein n=1 Tax=Arundo donax TaxID=35708 RepID=A0A0A9D9N5_ARUDO
MQWILRGRLAQLRLQQLLLEELCQTVENETTPLVEQEKRFFHFVLRMEEQKKATPTYSSIILYSLSLLLLYLPNNFTNYSCSIRKTTLSEK